MKLTVISHTGHHLNEDGEIVGWGPTIKELDYLTEVFTEITHVAVMHEGPAPHSAVPYTSGKVKFVGIKPFGGQSLLSKLEILLTIPSTINVIRKALVSADYYQFRAPTGIGVFVIPYLLFFVRKPGWFKYAGNWMQENAPMGYRVQKFWLRTQRRHVVTINGKWPNLPPNFKPFENPCLTQKEREIGEQVIARKLQGRSQKTSFCFVGRLIPSKGVPQLLQAFEQLKDDERIGTIHLVGDGSNKAEYMELAKQTGLDIVFHGFLAKEAIIEVFRKSDFNLLPSDSEGFPKSIAEGMNFGCIPIVTDISSIGQYVVNDSSGFLLPINSVDEVRKKILAALDMDNRKGMMMKGYDIASKFTFEYYNKRIKQEITVV